MNTTDEKVHMKTLASCMNKLREDGFKSDFHVKEDKLYLPESDTHYSPEQVRILDFYRFEGESDPSDSAILYAIETSTGEKGMLSDAYGPYADEKVSEFITQVEEIHKLRGNNTPKDKEI